MAPQHLLLEAGARPDGADSLLGPVEQQQVLGPRLLLTPAAAANRRADIPQLQGGQKEPGSCQLLSYLADKEEEEEVEDEGDF